MDELNGNNEEQPIEELKTFSMVSSPDLQGRVQRDINRRALAANGLEFSLTVMLQTFWEHLYSLLDSFPGQNSKREEDKNG